MKFLLQKYGRKDSYWADRMRRNVGTVGAFRMVLLCCKSNANSKNFSRWGALRTSGYRDLELRNSFSVVIFAHCT
jgi:hypothetical protein